MGFAFDIQWESISLTGKTIASTRRKICALGFTNRCRGKTPRSQQRQRACGAAMPQQHLNRSRLTRVPEGPQPSNGLMKNGRHGRTLKAGRIRDIPALVAKGAIPDKEGRQDPPEKEGHQGRHRPGLTPTEKWKQFAGSGHGMATAQMELPQVARMEGTLANSAEKDIREPQPRPLSIDSKGQGGTEHEPRQQTTREVVGRGRFLQTEDEPATIVLTTCLYRAGEATVAQRRHAQDVISVTTEARR